jgi:gluconate 2-dehydrogenase gamma chain
VIRYRSAQADNKPTGGTREEPMTRKHDDTRRAFLVGGAIGAGAAASAGLVPEAFAKSGEREMAMDAPAADHVAITEMSATNGGDGSFFNGDDAHTVAAFAERLMPGAPGKPGATDADVLNYIDLALSGAYQDQQYFYRCGLAQLDAHCAKTYGKSFRLLAQAQQDECIAALEHGKAPEFVWPTAQAFFDTLRKHTMEGMFADPVYGGNRDFAGWRLVGFPGAQPGFTREDMQSKDAFTRAPIVGLQSQAASASKRG